MPQPPQLQIRLRIRLLWLIAGPPLSVFPRPYSEHYPYNFPVNQSYPALANLRRTSPRVLLELAAEKENIPISESISHLRHIHSLVEQ